MRIALGVEYDGSRFCGWQTQPEGCAVQDALERALAEIAGARVATICAGRTDAGVHALAQVVHFDTAAERPDAAWVRGVNALLPPACAVTWMRRVPRDFHARYSALARCYRYVLLNHAVRPAADQARVGWLHVPLEVERMQRAAHLLLGEHDFSAFRSAECQARTPVRTLARLDVARRGDHVIFDFCANAFLHHMVRTIVGCLVYVGKGRYPPEWMGEVLASRDRARAAPTFDAAGLYLSQVKYEARWGLPATTRATFMEIGNGEWETGNRTPIHEVMATAVKICGITRTQDALAAARAGAHAIGLVFSAPSPRCVTPDKAAEIIRALPPFVTSVGLFVDAGADDVRATLKQAPVGLLQFHGSETPEFCRQFGRPYVKAVRVRPGVDLLQYARDYHDAKALLLDNYVEGLHGGSGVAFDWGLIPRGLPLPVILSGGLTAENVTGAVRRVRPSAVDVSSGVESAKGVKDAVKIAAFIKGVRNADV